MLEYINTFFEELNYLQIKFTLYFNLIRYFAIGGGFYLVFYVLFKKKWNYKKIQLNFPKNSDIYRDIAYSMTTILVFLIVGYHSATLEYNKQYADFNDYGWPYFFISLFIMIIIHDTYFYWMHRLIHHPKLFKTFHLVHHKSTNPSPWTAYAFHPYEAVLEAIFIYIIVLLLPYHILTLVTFLIFMMCYNVYGHLGYELYPKNFHKTAFGKWMNTAVTHNQHHKNFNGNYGLYFLFWDRIMGTVREDYDDAYVDATTRKKETN